MMEVSQQHSDFTLLSTFHESGYWPGIDSSEGKYLLLPTSLQFQCVKMNLQFAHTRVSVDYTLRENLRTKGSDW